MFSSHITKTNRPLQQRRIGRAGNVANLAGGRVSGGEELRSGGGRSGRKKLQLSEPPVDMATRPDAFDDFLPGVTAFLIADMGMFESSFVWNVPVVIVVPKPWNTRFQPNLVDCLHSCRHSAKGAHARVQLMP